MVLAKNGVSRDRLVGADVGSSAVHALCRGPWLRLTRYAAGMDDRKGKPARRVRRGRVASAAVTVLGGVAPSVAEPAHGFGDFEGASDVGQVQQKGTFQFDSRRKQYQMTSAGEGSGPGKDAFAFAWRRLSGDLALTAQVTLSEKGGAPHGQAGWMVRHSMDADSPYAGAVVYGDGVISMQYRMVKGGPTSELQAPVRATPDTALRLERTGDLFGLSVARDGKTFQPVGALTVSLPDPVYAGLAVCSQGANVAATGRFSRVALDALGVVGPDARVLESRLEVASIPDGQRRVIHETRDHIEAPNWSRDGRSLLFNSKGRLYSLPVKGGNPRVVDTGAASRLNNDHGLSPDGEWLAISHEPAAESLIYVVPAAGGKPRQVTALGPSYWHGWSPDGATLAYCARRNDQYDIYTIAATAEMSSDERRLTSAAGLDDGPDFSPDGGTIYFNSDRTGQMRIWRMNADGSDQRQLTFDDVWGDWFPHPSPDGKWLVFVSYDKSVKGHPANKDVALRIMPAAGGAAPRILTRLFGGQGTINVPSWSPDSREVAFVSYRLIRP
jgi:TolB protein